MSIEKELEDVLKSILDKYNLKWFYGFPANPNPPPLPTADDLLAEMAKDNVVREEELKKSKEPKVRKEQTWRDRPPLL